MQDEVFSAERMAASHARKPEGSAARRIVEIDTRDPRWDAFVVSTRGASAFHHSGWIAALERENGQRPISLACEEANGVLSGVLPLVPTRGLPFDLGGAGAEPRLSSLPRTPAAGPLATNEVVLRALVEAALERARGSRLRLQLKPTAPIPPGLVPELKRTPWRLSYVKPLPDDPEHLRFGSSRNHGRIRWAVGKAQREGLRVRDAIGEADLSEWYRLYLDVNRWRGLPSRPYRFFQAAWEHLWPKGFLRLLLVDRPRTGDPKILAGSVVLMLGDTAHYAFNGRAAEALPMHPNDLLQWHAIRDATAAGYRWYDFGEVEEGNEGLASFKAKWGTETRRLVRYHAPPLPNEEAGYAGLESTGRLHRITLGMWRRVPLSFTAFAGDRVHRFL
jgi:Acetyltransferase (GNAT) domain